MDYNINRQIAGINQINYSIKTTQEPLPAQRINTIISNLAKLLNQLEVHVDQGFTPLTEGHKPDISDALQELRETLHSYTHLHIQELPPGNYSQLKRLHESIEKIENAISMTTLFTRTISPLKAVSLVYFCDMNSSDHNGAILSRVVNAIKQEVPFIISASLLQCQGLKENKHYSREIDAALLMNQTKFQIYHKGGVLVFIPHSFLSEKSEKEKLEAFDFKTDGSLTKIHARRVNLVSQEKVTTTNIQNLFSDKPKANKIFHITGHGSPTKVAAMDKNEYKKFLSFLESQKCKGLAITSCSAGGESSLLSTPEEASKKNASFLDHEKPQSYPTIVHSLGDFASFANQEAQKDLKGFLNEFAKFIESSNVKTAEQFGKQVKAFEGGKGKIPFNLIKLYPAHSPEALGKFEVINERGEDFALTITKVRGAELASKKVNPELTQLKTDGEAAIIVIENAKRLEIYPLVTFPPLIFVEENPLLISMIPGDGQHYLREINLTKTPLTPVTEPETPRNFIRRTINFHTIYRGSDVGLTAKKSFFINEIKGSSTTLRKVQIFISKDSNQYTWQEGDKYYIADRKNHFIPEEISVYQHFHFGISIISHTKAKENSVRMSSAGQEGVFDCWEALKDEQFYSPILCSMYNPKDTSLRLTTESMELFKLEIQEKKGALIDYLHLAEPDIAFELIISDKEFQLPPSILERPYFWSYVSGRRELPEIIERAKIDTDCFGAMIISNNLDVVQLAVAKGAEINPKSFNEKIHPIEYANLDSEEGSEIFEWLLEQRMDLNLGQENTPFGHAIKSGDISLIELCIKHGANVKFEEPNIPLQKAISESLKRNDDPQGKIFECLLRGGLLLKHIVPHELATFLMKVHHNGNIELFKKCVNQLSIEQECELWEIITTHRKLEIAKTFIQETKGIFLNPESLAPLTKSNNAPFLNQLLAAGLDLSTL